MPDQFTTADMTPDVTMFAKQIGRFVVTQHSATVGVNVDRKQLLLTGAEAYELADALFIAAGRADPAGFGEMLHKTIGVSMAGSGSDIEGESVAEPGE